MKLELDVDVRLVTRLRACAAECGVELEELVTEGLRALAGAAPRRRRRRSTTPPAPLHDAAGAAGWWGNDARVE
jgi:hypothetical protein